MSFSQTAGIAIVPTLSRIVLALAFIATGYHKVTGDATYTEAQSQRLTELGVVLDAAPTDTPQVNPARFVQDQPVQPPAEPAPATDEPTTPATGANAPAQDPPKEPAEQPAAVDPPAAKPVPSSTPPAVVPPKATPPAATPPKPAVTEKPVVQPVQPDTATPPLDATPMSDETYVGKPLHHITLLVDSVGWPKPVLMGWLAAGTELAGGIFLLVGFLSRVWGLGLAVTMGVAFYLTSMSVYFGSFMAPLDVAANDLPTFQRVFTQLGLFVLAFGVFLTGPGPLSVDRLLFGRRDKSNGDVRMDRVSSARPPQHGQHGQQGSSGPSPRPL
jgi:uncharacterized membrane protein YphA (DoxX/SURF4 family)